ncbi:MAG: hypothetical protein RLO80_03080 [Hyphomonas sp.]
MKPITAFLLLSLAGAGTACSDTGTKATPEPAIETADAGSEVQGTLNLNIGKAPEGPGRQIIGSNTGSTTGGLIVAPGATGGNFEDVPDLGIVIEDIEDPLAAPAPKSDEDEIVRLPD